MTCREFETWLQSQADLRSAAAAEPPHAEHIKTCTECRELADGFRLLAQGFASGRAPVAPADLSERTAAILLRETAPREQARDSIRISENRGRFRAGRRIPSLLAIAASLLALIAVPWYLATRTTENSEPLAVTPVPDRIDVPLPEPDEPLFPDLAATDDADPRDGVMLDAVEPMSQLVRAFGRSLGSPVRPIAVNAGQAVADFLKDLNPPDSPMLMSVPGFPEMMQPPMNQPRGEGPSS